MNVEMRKTNVETLARAGFRVASSLPTERGAPIALRPLSEIATRLMALDALFKWVVFTEEHAATDGVRRYVQRNALDEALTDAEREALELPRAVAKAELSGRVGWRLENMWPLAWVLGFQPVPSFDGEMIAEEVMRPMLLEFLPGLYACLDDVLKRAKPRRANEVAALEDLFYCAHNAARSAQLGEDTVPSSFHPTVSAGVIHERRHALTWCLSPGVAWEDADLST